ncbi:MAG: HIT family protein [Clostridiales bacterium]|jgi:histidine triad (HIT) family protein|nr:HIT family protein [Clostridiales bacterium]
MRNDCIFCKIIKGDVPSYKVYEDEDLLVILDRFPRNTGECLVITKRHFDNLFELDPALDEKIFEISRRAAAKLKEAYPIDGLNLLQNNGEAAGQRINHFHLHVIPRYNPDSVVIKGKTLNPSEEEFEETADKLRL